MTSSLEKVFFNYILKNKKYFEIVRPYFFRNTEVQFVFGIIREYITKNSEAQIPTPRQILDMVSLEDKEGIITKEILKSLLTDNLKDYDEKNFVEPKFNAWVLTNRIKTGTVDIIDETRNFDNISDFDTAIEAANRIRAIVDDMSSTSFVDDDDMGSDFDEAELHIQDSSRCKVKSGFETIDHILGGGWDIGTFNCIMAETNNGKCFFYDGYINIRNIDNYEERSIKIGKIFTKVSKGDDDI